MFIEQEMIMLDFIITENVFKGNNFLTKLRKCCKLSSTCGCGEIGRRARLRI